MSVPQIDTQIDTTEFERFSFDKAMAYRNGSWVQSSNLSWSVTDIATTHGVMLVERLRTVGGKIIDSPSHLQRLRTGAAMVGLLCDYLFESIEATLNNLVLKNGPFIEFHGDVGVVVLLSPGDPGHRKSANPSPTLMMHLVPIPFEQLDKWYQQGCRLHVSKTCNVPAESWSPWIKTRSRLQYYLADNPPSPSSSSSTEEKSDSIAVLLSTKGNITETSVSNLVMVDRNGVLRSPSKRDILQGVSLAKVEEIAARQGMRLEYSDLSSNDFRRAAEILLTGTTGFLWAAVEFEGTQIGEGKPGPICKSIQQSWIDSLGFDFVKQPKAIAPNLNAN